MPINDGNHERRNLTVLSLSIIAFIVGKGELGENGVLRLPLMNINFHNGHFLGYLVWLILCWFAFRYWIENKDDAKDKIYFELNRKRYGLKYFKKWLCELFLIDDKERLQFINYNYIKDPRLSENNLFLTYVGSQNSNGAFDETNIDMVNRRSVELRLIRYVSVCILFFNKPTLSAYYAPFVLFWIAIALGIYNSMPCYLCGLF